MSSIPDDFASANDPETLAGRIVTRFCAGMLSAALPSKVVADLAGNRPIVVVLEAPGADWVDFLEEHLRQTFPGALVVARHQSSTRGLGNWTHQALLPFLHSRPVIAVSQDPVTYLSALLLDTADHHILLARPNFSMVRDCIIDLTAAVPRRLRAADVDMLDAGQLLASLRPAASAGTMARRIAAIAAKAPKLVKVPDAPALEALALPQDIALWAKRIVTDLPGGRTEGLEHTLIEGPPGTGKTLLVQSLAAAAGLPLVMTNVAHWHQVGKGHLNDVLGAQAAFFAELKRLAPAIGVIDELDSVPSREDLRGEYDPWWIGMTNSLLTQIDALAAAEKPVLLIGITNHARRLDPALVRAGRLGRHLTLPPPGSAEQRLKMLRLHLPLPFAEADLSALLPYLANQSQAELRQVAVAARARAGDEGRSLHLDHLLEVLAPPDTRSLLLRRAVALHEAGHAVMAVHQGRTVRSVSILPGAGHEGETDLVPIEGVMAAGDVETDLRILLAGRAADMIAGTGPNSGARSDLARAADLIHDACFNLLFFGPTGDWAGRGAEFKDRRHLVEERLDHELKACIAILTPHRPALVAVAEALLARTVLGTAELGAVLAPFGLGGTDSPGPNESSDPFDRPQS